MLNGINTIELTEEQEMLQKTIRSYMDKNVKPIVSEYEQKKEFPFELFKELKQFGYVGGMLPEESGGMGMLFSHQAILMQEAGRVWGSLRALSNTLTMFTLAIDKFGTKEQKEKYLTPVLEGEKTRLFIAVTEPNHGSDVSGMETYASKEGNGYRINGSKMFITNGSIADYGILFAKTDREAGKKGITAFIIDPAVSKYEAHNMDKLFIRATKTSVLHFDDMWVPEENVLGNVGEGLKISLSTLNLGRLNVAMGCVGIAIAALEDSVEYVKQRKQFGREIGSFQMVQDMIVEMLTLTESARLLGLKAADVLDEGHRGNIECSMAKLVATDHSFKVANLALQVHGGNGYMEEFPIERYFRDARGTLIPEGTSQIQKLIIGRELLGLSAFS